MHIYFGGRNALMAQHLLNGSEISPVFQQVGRKRVSEGMRAYGFFQAYFLSQLLLGEILPLSGILQKSA